jgi:hypothetical protein
MDLPTSGGQIWTPITPQQGSELHAVSHCVPEKGDRVEDVLFAVILGLFCALLGGSAGWGFSCAYTVTRTVSRRGNA